ncbi:MAG: TetR/AcrR family transcriptional regulator [Deltaproteobacteria bacterium]|nr:MAG: TetR/AcrR family transcriptional regulator [Deltaproteobacteria bacterium]
MGERCKRGPGRPRDAKRAARRRAGILQAAADCFAEHGFATTEVQTIADRLGIGKGTIYRYFPTKEELFRETVSWCIERLGEHVTETMAAFEDPIDQICASVFAYIDFFARNRESIPLLLLERTVLEEKPIYFQRYDVKVEEWQARFQALIDAGRVRRMPVERITNVVSTLLYGTILTNYLSGKDRPPRDQAHDILDVIFHGILNETIEIRLPPDAFGREA